MNTHVVLGDEDATMAMLEAGWGICGTSKSATQPDEAKIREATEKYRNMLAAARKRSASRQPEPEWISVYDRLPEHRQRVLFCFFPKDGQPFFMEKGEFVEAIAKNGIPAFISFDHDLGAGHYKAHNLAPDGATYEDVYGKAKPPVIELPFDVDDVVWFINQNVIRCGTILKATIEYTKAEHRHFDAEGVQSHVEILFFVRGLNEKTRSFIDIELPANCCFGSKQEVLNALAEQ